MSDRKGGYPSDRHSRRCSKSRLFSIVLATIAVLPSLLCDHTVEAWTARPFYGRICRPIVAAQKRPFIALATPRDDNNDTDDDDGWGSPSSTADKNNNKAVLESLKSERRLSQQQQQSQSAPSTSKQEEPQRDLFIPIFTLVSVVGFGGLYAYETLRLYMNGELYLPGGN